MSDKIKAAVIEWLTNHNILLECSERLAAHLKSLSTQPLEDENDPKIVVDRLNDRIAEQLGGDVLSYIVFEYRTDGCTYDAIYIANNRIWCNYEDEREFDEDLNEYEPLLDYCLKQLKQLPIVQVAKHI